MTKYLLQNANATKTGSIAIVAPASIKFHDAADSPDDLSAISPTINVRWFGAVNVKMFGIKYSFHELLKAKIATVAKIGFNIGSIILKNTPTKEQPSIFPPHN